MSTSHLDQTRTLSQRAVRRLLWLVVVWVSISMVRLDGDNTSSSDITEQCGLVLEIQQQLCWCRSHKARNCSFSDTVLWIDDLGHWLGSQWSAKLAWSPRV